VSGADQLTLVLPLDPVALARLLAHERAAVYRDLGLDHQQREVAEYAVPLAMAERSGRAR
jgi:hypothetical protein